MKLYHFAIAVLLVITLTGCDWLRSNLGLLTSSQMEELKTSYKKEQEAKVASSDTATVLMQDSLSVMQGQAADVNHNVAIETSVRKGSYYLIFGVYQEKTNVQKMSNAISRIGFKPVSIITENGRLEMVAAGPYSTESEARKMIEGFPANFEYDLSDVWIYRAR